MQLRQGVEREGRERRQTNEVRLVLLGEVTLQPVGGLDEPVVLAIRADQRDRQPTSHRRVIVELVAEVSPRGMGPQLLIRESQRAVHLVDIRVDPNSPRGRALP